MNSGNAAGSLVIHVEKLHTKDEQPFPCYVLRVCHVHVYDMWKGLESTTVRSQGRLCLCGALTESVSSIN